MPQSLLRRIAGEPFCHFVVLGALIYLAGSWWNGTIDERRIVVSPDLVRQIATGYRRQYGMPPTGQQLQSLIDGHLREEMLYREGMALHLERDDEIVRRRIAQKYEFLQQDLGKVAEPDDAALARYYQTNLQKYASPERVSFTHIYFSADQGGDQAAAARAAAVLKSLAANPPERAPQLGDRYADLYDYAALAPDEAARAFGASPMAEALFQVPLRQWAGPYKSGFGWHLIRVSTRDAARQRPLAEVRDRVLADYQEQARQDANRAAFDQLRKKYTIIRADAPANGSANGAP